MKSLNRKIIILISVSSIVTGAILFIFQLNIIPEDFNNILFFLVQLWPVTLIIAGFLFLWNSFARRRYLQAYAAVEKTLTLPYPPHLREVNLDIAFSSGRLMIDAADSAPSVLRYDQFGPMPDPSLEIKNAGNTSKIRLHKAKQYFAASSRIRNSWYLSLEKGANHVIALSIQDADCSLDLRDILVEKLSLKTGHGLHTLFFPAAQKFHGDIYSGSDRLCLMFPDNSFVRVNLINPFCRVDFPQGDFEKKADGTILSIFEQSDTGLIELDVDGPLKQLTIDIV